jgi:adenylate kinase
MKTLIHFLGIAGSGKGTQSKLLAKTTQWPIIEVGAICRALAQEDSEQGRMIQATVERGELIPFHITVKAVIDDVLSHSASIQIIDGFPRDNNQVSSFKEQISHVDVQVIIVHLKISEEEAMKRLLKRKEIEGRTDDTPEGIAKRFGIYYADTLPAIEALKVGARYISIQGEQSIEAVQADIQAELKDLLSITL